MNIHLSDDWLMRKAKKEGKTSVGAGHPPFGSAAQQKPKTKMTLPAGSSDKLVCEEAQTLDDSRQERDAKGKQ
ncbi:hypothetical protein KBI23_17765 [bacterium]|nr:hypothetical protein [bacterium]MBP9806784.1 hypothetical protein [bacterium]